MPTHIKTGINNSYALYEQKKWQPCKLSKSVTRHLAVQLLQVSILRTQHH
jgi:hypothetical protein